MTMHLLASDRSTFEAAASAMQMQCCESATDGEVQHPASFAFSIAGRRGPASSSQPPAQSPTQVSAASLPLRR
jgi:hypothetical protein